MRPRHNFNKQTTNDKNYTRTKRIFWMSIGFCPNCLGPLDSFPDFRCHNCKYKQKMAQVRSRERNRK